MRKNARGRAEGGLMISERFGMVQRLATLVRSVANQMPLPMLHSKNAAR